MAGLILKLRPGEQLLINGVVVENGDKKTRLRIRTEGAHILRLREAMKPEEAVTPLRRAYYIAQMAVAGLLEPYDAVDALNQTVAEFDAELTPEMRDTLRARLAAKDFYQTMRRLGELMAQERGPKDADSKVQAPDRSAAVDLSAPKLRPAMTG
ncbi:MAG: flagellar biosynthesis repressor FlbT [Pseudomonadota bacterium]